MPAIVDHAPADGGAPISVFESGAILLYLAEKTGRFLGLDEGSDPATRLRQRVVVNEWLFWQMGGLGPMTGQYGHFHVYAPEEIPYARDRYRKEAERLLSVLDKRLAARAFIAGDDYSIADMASYPWISPYDKAPLDLAPFANVRRWQAAIRERPATQRAYALTRQVNPDAGKPISEEERKLLFGQGAR
jgi:GST-like protein